MQHSWGYVYNGPTVYNIPGVMCTLDICLCTAFLGLCVQWIYGCVEHSWGYVYNELMAMYNIPGVMCTMDMAVYNIPGVICTIDIWLCTTFLGYVFFIGGSSLVTLH